jgi:diguanylate cyclase (GGDEF)-like protein/PAS domain S-box-containing protein
MLLRHRLRIVGEWSEAGRRNAPYAAAAVLLPLAALGGQLLLDRYLGMFRFLLFYPAVFFTAWIAGRRWGLIATLLSTMLIYYFFFPPRFTFVLESYLLLLPLSIFVTMGTLFSVVHGHLQAAIQRGDEAYAALQRSSESRFRALIEHSQDGVALLDADRTIRYVSGAVVTSGGYTPEELVGRSALDHIHPDDVVVLERAVEQTLAKPGSAIPVLARRRHKDGRWLWLEGSLTNLLDNAAVGAIVINYRDVTVRKERELLLAQQAAIIASSDDAIVGEDLNSTVTSWNAGAERMFGYSADEMVGESIMRLMPADRVAEEQSILARIANGERVEHFETVRVCRSGNTIHVSVTASPIRDGIGQVVGASLVGRDITARKQAEQRLQQAAQYDLLTGLPNRMLLAQRMRQAIALAERHRRRLAVLFLDLDRFKHINDSLGHAVGDSLLQSVTTRCLQTCVRTADTLSRLGGDEFVVLLSEIEQPADAATIARRMLRAVAESHSVTGHDVHVTASIGISIYPADGRDADTLIKNADTAMYQAKENGRQRYRFFEPTMNARALERRFVEEGLRDALKREELTLHYQPKIDLKSRRVAGAEALIRWMHPTRGLTLPADFIPVAEDSGLIVAIGNWVLREACRQARAWSDAGLTPGNIGVNVSAVEFTDEQFLPNLVAVLDHTGLDPALLELELTESALMKRGPATDSVLETLRTMGVKLAIDDFGTGYSSLSYLQRFPISALKIDQSFIRSHSERSSVMTPALIELGHRLRMRVVAEGVETDEDVTFLASHHCDEAQGHYFSPPLASAQFESLLQGQLMASPT